MTKWLERLLRSPRGGRIVAFLVAAAGAMVLAVSAAAVSVSPVALYLNARSRSGTLTLYNPGTRPEEVEVGFAFGYPQSDDDGNVTVPVVAKAPDGEPSAVEWLRAFPRRLVLEPGQRQVVRVLAEPPANLPEGEYWARVLVKGRGGQPPIERQQGDVRVQIDVETVVVVALSFRNGNVKTGVRIEDASAERTEAGIVARVDLERTGNAAFIGRVRAEALDANGRVVGSVEDVLAVYRTMRRKLVIPADAGTQPAVRVRFRVDNEREDLPPGATLPAEAVTHTIDISGP